MTAEQEHEQAGRAAGVMEGTRGAERGAEWGEVGCGAVTLEKAAASGPRDGGSCGGRMRAARWRSSCMQRWEKKISLAFFSLWRNHAEGEAR